MKSFFQILLLLFLFSLSHPACIPGENCPYNQGECNEDQCICKDGFFTIIDSSKEDIEQVFCDYEQISMKLMLLMEVLLPSSGQFLAQRWLHGAIKLAIVVLFLSVSIFVTKQLLIPKCFVVAKKALIGGGDDDKKNDDGKEKEEQEHDGKEKDTNVVDDCMTLQDVRDLNFGGEGEGPCKNFCFRFSRIIIYIFWTVYSLDIYFIFFQLYSDGKGIPFGD